MTAADNRKLEKTSTPGIYRRHTNACKRDGRCRCQYVRKARDGRRSSRRADVRTVWGLAGVRVRPGVRRGGVMAPVLTVHPGSRDDKAASIVRVEKTRQAAEALAELAELLDWDDPLKRACGLLATCLDGRVKTGRA
jgi:hypothetical protein